MLSTIIIFVFILGLLVFVHELGHFLTAKKMGVAVDEFGFGFPPRIFGIKRGGTIYSINLVPLGGFVKIKGEAGEAASDSDSFASKKTWQKISILSAGVAMNFALAYVLFSFGFMIGLPQEVTDQDIAAHRAFDVGIIITEVASQSVADQAGIHIGDRLVSIDQQQFQYPDDAIAYIRDHTDKKLAIDVKRGSQSLMVEAQPAAYPGTDHPILGISMVRSGIIRYGFFEAFYQGFKATLTIIVLVVLSFAHMIYGLFVGQGLGNQISGPVGVAVLTGRIAQLGFAYLLNFTALLSVNLGILNIIPFPALDGGRVLFAVIEKIKGKPVRARTEALFHNIGFGLLITLVIFVTYKDFLRYGSQIWKGITSFLG